MKGYIKCECGVEVCLPTHPIDIYKVCVYTVDAMSFTTKCECGKYITMHLSYIVIDCTIE